MNEHEPQRLDPRDAARFGVASWRWKSAEPTEEVWTEHPTRIMLAGTVPVSVEVDITTGEVLRVVVEDDRHEWAEPLTGWGVDTAHNPTADQLDAARTAADDAEWPVWEFGW